MKLFFIIIILMVFSAYSAEVSNEICPVMTDERVESHITMQYQGKPVAFCCKDCRRDFAENPEKFSENLRSYAQSFFTRQMAENEAVNTSAETHGHETNEDHDHKADHGKPQKSLPEFLGRFHPIAVHLPIGLLLGAFLAELCFLIFKRQFFEHASSFMLITGSIAALGAAALGWLSAMQANYPGELAEVLDSHRWLGISTTVFALAASICRIFNLKKGSRKLRICTRVLLILTVLLLAVTGHFGGTLIYGKDYFSW
ncbi:DUF2231 domain-containing protein [Lentisphaera marina]|uniref:DUF2231 domain-containing protein n=1 Tax=Lentisphaera marina TaxID=1111041 RepID=UPI002366902D|nr:DUF2231 domain-containing protein [Lentisphaera marina]MDD7984361.1 DUF2231 domain-containing protein [Lentisphaera marina]